MSLLVHSEDPDGMLHYAGSRSPDKSAYWIIIFFISHPKHVVGTQKNNGSLFLISSSGLFFYLS